MKNRTASALNSRMEKAREANRGFFIKAAELKQVEIAIKAKEYGRWRDDDSPKGENVPGVRYRDGAEKVPSYCPRCRAVGRWQGKVCYRCKGRLIVWRKRGEM